MDLHGTDDVDEFGVNAPECVASFVHLTTDATQIKSAAEAKRSSEDMNTDKDRGVEHGIQRSVVDELQEVAVAHGITYSEWYEVSNKSVDDILIYLEAMASGSSAGASSST